MYAFSDEKSMNNKYIVKMAGFAAIAAILVLGGVGKTMAADTTIDQIKGKYPHGAYWNHVATDNHQMKDDTDQGSCNDPDGYTWTPCSSHEKDVSTDGYACNTFEGSKRSCGFVKKLAFDLYGSCHTDWQRASIETAKPGDIIRYFGAGADPVEGHWAMIISKSGNTFTFAECDVDANCRISWGRTMRMSSMTGYELYSAPYMLSEGTGIYYDGVMADLVGETNATLCAKINNPKKHTFTKMGVKIWDAEGNLLVDYSENCQLQDALINQRYNIEKDISFAGLQPGKQFRYQIWATADDITYKTVENVFTTLEKEKPRAAYGDVTLDGEVNAEDALAVLRHVVRLQPLTGMDRISLADVNHDASISAEDALLILKITVKLRELEYTDGLTLEE